VFRCFGVSVSCKVAVELGDTVPTERQHNESPIVAAALSSLSLLSLSLRVLPGLSLLTRSINHSIARIGRCCCYICCCYYCWVVQSFNQSINRSSSINHSASRISHSFYRVDTRTATILTTPAASTAMFSTPLRGTHVPSASKSFAASSRSRCKLLIDGAHCRVMRAASSVPSLDRSTRNERLALAWTLSHVSRGLLALVASARHAPED